jgi:hypothetical protein
MIRLLIEVQLDAADEGVFFTDLRQFSDGLKAESHLILWKTLERTDSEHPGGETDTRMEAFASLREASEFGVASGPGYQPLRIAGRR